MKIIALLLVLPLGIIANVDTFLEFQTQVTNTAEFQLPATSTTTFDHSSFLTTSILFSSITDSSLSALYTTTILTELATHTQNSESAQPSATNAVPAEINEKSKENNSFNQTTSIALSSDKVMMNNTQNISSIQRISLSSSSSQPIPASRRPIPPPVEEANIIRVDEQAHPQRFITKFESVDPSSATEDTQESHPENSQISPDAGNSGQLVLPGRAEEENQSNSSSNAGIIIGALLGVALLIFSVVAYYRTSANKRSSRDIDDNQLELRYSLEQPQDSSSEQKHSSDQSLSSSQNHVFVAENDQHLHHMNHHIDFESSSSLNSIPSFCGTPEEASEVLDIARSAQNAAQISGYLTKKYAAHDSIVSYDSFA